MQGEIFSSGSETQAMESSFHCNVVLSLETLSNIGNRSGGAVGKSVGPASERLGVRILAATDPSR